MHTPSVQQKLTALISSMEVLKLGSMLTLLLNQKLGAVIEEIYVTSTFIDGKQVYPIDIEKPTSRN